MLQTMARNPSLVLQSVSFPVAVVVFFFALVVHESAHGWVASLCGDDTAKYAGRITLNPLAHIDPLGTIMFPLFLALSGSRFVFGWAKPVPINPFKLRNPRRDLAKVGASGPVSNIALAVASSFLIWVVDRLPIGNLKNSVLLVLFFTVLINLFLAVFNLVPVPPLDGAQILSAVLPRPLATKFELLTPFGFLIILMLLITGLLWRVVLPVVQGLYSVLFLWV